MNIDPAEVARRATEDPKGLLSWLMGQGWSPPALPPDEPIEVLTGTKHALVCGVERVWPSAYGGSWDGALVPAVRNDVRLMVRTLTDRGFQVWTLLEDGTRDAFSRRVMDLARRAVAGDLVVIYFSGHGGQLPEMENSIRFDETDGLDETLCFPDGQMVDDELRRLFGQFQPGVRVIFIADSCHSGTVTRTGREPMAFVSEDMEHLILAKAMPPDVVEPAYLTQREAYDAARSRPLDASRRTDGPAVLLLGGCEESGFSYSLPDQGAFTLAMAQSLAAGARTMGDLLTQMRKRIRTRQVPTADYEGPGDLSTALRWPVF